MVFRRLILGYNDFSEPSSDTKTEPETKIIVPNKTPKFWIVGLINLNSKTSQCDLQKTLKSYEMFWNDDLFEKLIWLYTPDQNESIHKAQKNYPPTITHYIPITESDFNMVARIDSKTKIRSPGYEFQQWATLHVDLYVKELAFQLNVDPPAVIGIVDSDAQFQTFPTIKNVFPFEDGRLKVHGFTAKEYSETTQILLGLPQAGDFMTTFPIYIHFDTLFHLRSHVERLHRKSFKQAFEDSIMVSPAYYSQFAFIHTFTYFFEHDLYSYHIQDYPGVPPGGLWAAYSPWPEERIPVPRISVHTKFNPHKALFHGCCFSYWPYIKNHIANLTDLCEKGDVENHFELVVENLWAYPDASAYEWRFNDTVTKHYEKVWEVLENFDQEKLKYKIGNCSKYIQDVDYINWFPEKDTCQVVI